MRLDDICSVLRHSFNFLLGILVFLAVISSLNLIGGLPFDLLDLAIITTLVGAAGYSPALWSRLLGGKKTDVSRETESSEVYKSPPAEIPAVEIKEEEFKVEKIEKPRVAKAAVREQNEGKLTGEDFMFLLGLGLFILFLALAHPSTPSLSHDTLIFWMSVTMLFLSMAPDYVNREKAREWLEEYGESRLEGLYRRIYEVARDSERYFSSDRFFLVGIALTILAVITLFHTGEIPEPVFGISYGIFMRAILV
ncbi:hypothetical protein AKJ65_03520 [candidate division MSBL1 archaeon SCGC-AAA259E19]|uniref:Uncharacterized protein n=1 Tax=candidate division MSBL1 archaeon SCGC-AAA259E19 TaxID=1698264 RepID=A0A133UKW3_9EURY|nr:hypothetical protein AKJ65_03520 [candidate division MSBL1 archaeon SCGC-AAA259E19]